MADHKVNSESCKRPKALTAIVESMGENPRNGKTHIGANRATAPAAYAHRSEVILERPPRVGQSHQFHSGHDGIRGSYDDGHVSDMLHEVALLRHGRNDFPESQLRS